MRHSKSKEALIHKGFLDLRVWINFHTGMDKLPYPSPTLSLIKFATEKFLSFPLHQFPIFRILLQRQLPREEYSVLFQPVIIHNKFGERRIDLVPISATYDFRIKEKWALGYVAPMFLYFISVHKFINDALLKQLVDQITRPA